MSDLYLALGLAVIAINLTAGVVGGLAWQGNRVSMAFWYLLRAGQLATVVFVVAECIFYAGGHRAEDQLHYLYVFLPVIASLLAEAMRGAAASQELGETDFKSLPENRQQAVAMAIVRRETGVMTVATLVIAFLIWRAIATTSGMF
ncbi:MAG: hypothetical protein M3Y23_03860 [Actinomycetota bacterium]|nr:hypothetical protein [Actinomycetota bacterium]